MNPQTQRAGQTRGRFRLSRCLETSLFYSSTSDRVQNPFESVDLVRDMSYLPGQWSGWSGVVWEEGVFFTKKIC